MSNNKNIKQIKTNFGKRDAFKVFGVVTICAVFTSFLLTLVFPSISMGGLRFWFKQALYSSILALAAFIYANIKRYDFLESNKIKKAPKAVDAVLLCVALFFLINGMTPINAWFCDLIEKFGFNRPAISLTVGDLEKNLPWAIVALCFVAPVCEEIIFRGTIGSGLLNGLNSKISAVLIGGALFSLFHVNPAQTVHQFFVGCVLMVFFIDGSYWTVFLGHFFNNFATVVLSLTVDKTGFYQDNAIIIAVSGLTLFFAAMAGYFIVVKRRRKQNPANPENTADAELKASDPSGYTLLVLGLFICTTLWIMELLS